MKYFKKATILILLLVTGIMLVQTGRAMAFNPFDRPTSTGSNSKTKKVCQGKAKTESVACKSYTTNPFTGNDGVIVKASLLLSWVVGLAAVVIIMYSGLQFMLARGDPQKAVNARNTILYAAVGLVVAVMAQAIIAFALNRLFK